MTIGRILSPTNTKTSLGEASFEEHGNLEGQILAFHNMVPGGQMLGWESSWNSFGSTFGGSAL